MTPPPPPPPPGGTGSPGSTRERESSPTTPGPRPGARPAHPGRLGLLARLRRGDRSARLQRRFQRRVRARRWQAWRRVLLLLAAVVAVVGGVWLVFFSSVLAVHRVEVTGVEVLTVDEVKNAAVVPLDVPLATSDLDVVAARVEDLAPVKSVEVSRDWPDGVRIEVTERSAVAVVAWEDGWRGVDEDGVLFRDYAEKPDGLPLLVARAATPAAALAEAAQVVEALPDDVRERAVSLRVGSIDDIEVTLRGGATVVWGSADESAEKAEVLTLLMEQKARSYNVSAPARPTIRR